MSNISKALLLGDSIRMSYQPLVAKMLNNNMDVVGPRDNCQFSLFTLASLDRWIDELGCPDIVHWNNGLHDAGRNFGRSPVQIPIDMYCANLEFILKRLQELTPNIIWATTTPVHPNSSFGETGRFWRNEEIDLYNDVAQELMQTHGIPVNDLHKLVWDNMGAFLSEDQLHLSNAGQKACAQAVAEALVMHS